MNKMIRGTVLLSCLLSTAVFAQAQLQAPAPVNKQPRLSGIVANETRRVAIVELPNSGTVMVRIGDVFDGGRVVEITQQTMRVRYPEGDRLFGVAFSGSRPVTEVNQLDAVGSGRLPVVGGSEAGDVLMRSMTKDVAIKRLDELLATGNVKGGLSEMLRPLLDLPKQANITEIDHQPLGTTKESLAAIRQSLAQGSTVTFGVSGHPGKKQLYLMPRGDDIAIRK